MIVEQITSIDWEMIANLSEYSFEEFQTIKAMAGDVDMLPRFSETSLLIRDNYGTPLLAFGVIPPRTLLGRPPHLWAFVGRELVRRPMRHIRELRSMLNNFRLIYPRLEILGENEKSCRFAQFFGFSPRGSWDRYTVLEG